MNWSDLPFFLAVVRTGQLARAAQQLGTDATTVGRRIRRLERDLGERLFEQDTDGQTLTPAGAALLPRAERMAEIASGLDARAPDQVSGTARISVSEGFGSWFIAPHLHELADRHPALEIDLVATSGFLNPTRRETDLAVLLARPRRGPLITRKLTDYRLSLFAAADYLAAHPPITQPDHLAGHRLIGYIPDIIYAPELRYLDELPIASTPVLRSSSINAQHRMIAAGAGIGVLPRFIGAIDPALSVVLPDLSITRTFWLATHRETHRFAQVRAVTDWLVDLTQQHRPLLIGD